MTATNERVKAYFDSGGVRCAAWHYPGRNGACVLMAAGLGVVKEPGTDLLAQRFHESGYGVLAFDYRCLGESEGLPRQLVRVAAQLADWQAAIEFARTLPGVAPHRLAIWGFSVSGGHVFTVAARNPSLAAAIAHSPLSDGLDAMRNAVRHTTPTSLARLMGRAAADAIGGLFGREPLLVPLAGERGTVASLTTPDSRNGALALNPGNRYPFWQQAVAARSAVRVGFYRPGRHASRIRCPLLVLAYDADGVAPPGPAIRAAGRAPRGELTQLPGGHYEAFSGGHERAVATMLDFLARQLAGEGAGGRNAHDPTAAAPGKE